jgi:hypothetical protein
MTAMPAVADQEVDILFYEEWMTHWPLKGLGEALARDEILAANPKVNGQALRDCFLPVQTAFEKTMSGYFGEGNNESVDSSQERKTRFIEAYEEWQKAFREFVAYVQQLPIAINLTVDNGKAAYADAPALIPLFGEVPFQTLIVTVTGKDPKEKPRFREETVNLSQNRDITIQTDGRGPELIRLQVAGLPTGAHAYTMNVQNETGETLAMLPLEISGAPSGRLKVRIVDGETGQPTSARVGIYGKSGFFRAGNAIPLFVHETEEYERVLYDPMWPSDDKRVFYSPGAFEMGLPPGEYRILVRKGIERLLYEKRFVVVPGEELALNVPMTRWTDMPNKGWYSGDDHIHVRRNGENNVPIMQWVQAEDIHVSNIVQMDDINTQSFLQYAWGEQSMFVDADYVLRSGQEGPRTNFRGHVLFFNLTHAIYDHDTYYIYEDVFDQAHKMGALGGYAHYGVAFGAERGMSIDVPLGKVDFLEVMENYGMNTTVLHHFWNMGYRIVPTAGSDFPYNPTAGNVLTYAYVNAPFSFDGWFDALRAGHTFVTDGPMIEFTVNGKIPGSEIALSEPGRVTIHATAKVNPSIDTLDRLEVLQFGQPIQTATTTSAAGGLLELSFNLDVSKSTWVAARAFGKTSKGHTNAVYIAVNGEPTWNPDTLEAELDRAEQVLKEVEAGMADGSAADAVLQANKSRLDHYIKAARERYSALRDFALRD